MPEYIEREALIDYLTKATGHKATCDGCCDIDCVDCIRDEVIKNLPAADVVEVRHGEWVLKSEIYKMPDDVDENFYVECPFCQRNFYVPFEFEEEKMLAYAKENYPYCNCGAKMDGKGECDE